MSPAKSIVSALVIAMTASVAMAQDANAQKALAKAQYLLRQASAEKAELQTQLDASKQQVEKLTKELASTKSGAGSDKQKLEQKYGEALTQWKTHGDKLNEQLEVARAQIKKEAEQHAQLETSLKTQSDNFALCYDNNKKLYSINQDLLGRYQHKGIVDVLGQKEPFTGLKQVEVENLIQDYQYQIDSLKIKNSSVDSINEPGGRVATP